jgi:UDP-glucose 4-epimerase
VTAVDDLSNGRKENLVDGVDFILTDITKDAFFDKLAGRSFDTVIHCAAQSSNALSFRDPKRDMLTNQFGTLQVLELCVKKGVKRFIFTSSMSVYGQPSKLPTGEETPCRPDSFYAVHKLGSEHYIRLYGRDHGLNCTIFRLYTTYGYGQNLANRDQGLLSIYLSYLVRKEKLIVKGSKDRTRDIIHISDVVSAIKDSLDNPRSYGRIYNLGTGRNMRIEDIIGLLLSGLSYKKKDYPISYEGSTRGDPFDTLADIRAAKRELDWSPRIPAKEGIRLTVERYKSGGLRP